MTAMGNFDLSKETLNFIVNITRNVCMRTIYYILCMRNKELELRVLLQEHMKSCIFFTSKNYVKFKKNIIIIIIITIY